ncbi:MAG: 6-phosphofructokinase [candidate division KSB1 bacterium]|nr:6-phosphofructokinase [candidate division KSB1 bacterium]
MAVKGNAVYAQSGGVTSVINASAYGVIKAAQQSGFIENIYAGLYGINGILEENLIDIKQEAPEAIEGLRYTPSAAFGSCRRKLGDLQKHREQFERLIQVFKAHNIRYFFYNGGNDSMDTAYKVSRVSKELGYEVIAIGVPKTVDNDLPETDNCPGYGSVAKYNAVSIREGSLDVESMHRDSTKVFVMESMGRHAGWIVGATGLAAVTEKDGPHIILFPERIFNEDLFLSKVEETVAKIGFCVVAVSEGVRRPDGTFLADSGLRDAFGHAQLGGAALEISKMIMNKLKLKVHTAILDYCQRSGRHIASKTDVEQAIACGRKAVELAAEGKNGFMPIIVRDSDNPYKWHIGETDIANIANKEKPVPDEFIREDGFHITDAFRRYALPLIEGEDYPPYVNGLPAYVRLKNLLIPKKLS